MEKENTSTAVNFDLNFENPSKNIDDATMQGNSRFADPLSETDMNNLIKSAVPQNTERKSRWAVNIFTEWAKTRSIKEPILSMDNMTLNQFLCGFITEVRNKAGEHYRPNTLYEIITSIQHYLRQNGKVVSFLDDNEFRKMRQVLDARMKEVAKTGLGSSRRKAAGKPKSLVSTKRKDYLAPIRQPNCWTH
ncbi:zinc finger MYM-type protein 2-like [Saccostrea cucullata]|uniref:zinc finger MYM-type protein 2-like n=1 Tax=Saccostrea cuccullata TaxID=36930 RepID=UPI002ED4E158